MGIRIGIGRTIIGQGSLQGNWTPLTLVAPSNLVVTTISDIRIDLNWQNNDSLVDGFLVFRSSDGVNFTQIADVVDEVTYSDVTCNPYTTYSYKVEAYYDTSIIRVKPSVVSASISNSTTNKVDILFSQDMRKLSTSANSAFTLTGKTISNVSIAGSVVTLTVTVPYINTDTVTVSYTTPVTNPLEGKIGNVAVDSFSNLSVTNNIIGTVPVLISLVAENATPNQVVVTYNQTLDNTSVPATTDFTVTNKAISSVAVTGSTVVLTLSTDISAGDNFYLTYTGGTNKIKGSTGGHAVANISSTLITNNVIFAIGFTYSAGVGQLAFQLDGGGPITLTATGQLYFYTDAGCTQNKSQTKTLTTGNAITYIKYDSNVASTIQISNPSLITEWGIVNNWVGYYAPSGPYIASCDISKMTGLTKTMVISAGNTGGSITNLTSLVSFSMAGYTQLTGDPGLNNMVNGIIGELTFGTTCRINQYTPGAVWSNANITWNTEAGYGLSSAQIDNILIDMAASPTLISKTITLQGANAARTSASDAAVAILTGAGRTNTLHLH